MGRFGTTELIVIFLIVLVLFGSKKLPEIGRGLGKGIQNFRKSVKGEDEIDVSPEAKSNPEQLDSAQAKAESNLQNRADVKV